MPTALKNTIPLRVSGDPKSEAKKPRSSAEALGQVFTPPEIALAMVNGLGLPKNAKGLLLLDPCVGPATFPKAVRQAGCNGVSIKSYDVDPSMVRLAKAWAETSDTLASVQQADYLEIETPELYDFAILNPPYLRQEWINKKSEYLKSFLRRYNVKVPGTSNLYVYFLVKAISELKPGGRLACIIYDSWQSTLYGKWLQEFLGRMCSSVTVEPVSNLPFAGRLIDATVVYCTRGIGINGAMAFKSSERFSDSLSGLKTIDEIFQTKRGLRLKQADFFLSNAATSNLDGGMPFVKKVNLVQGYNVSDEHSETALLITNIESNKLAQDELARRLELAKRQPDKNVSILTWHRERPDSWMFHSAAPVAPLLFNYYIRNRPKHIYNSRRAYSDNFYGCIPRTDRAPLLSWLAALNSTLSSIGIMEQARNQGAGLAKLQLFEYRLAKVVDLDDWARPDVKAMEELGAELISTSAPDEVIKKIDQLVFSVLGNIKLQPTTLNSVLDNVCALAKKPK